VNAIEVEALTKSFGSFKAVDGISFEVKKGEIFGFLGANGAGKTTTIRMLCGILAPTSGAASVAGFDIATEADQLKRNIGYMSQRFSLYDDLTVAENLDFFGGIYQLSKSKMRQRAEWVMEMAGLKGREKQITATLSGAVKQRLALGCSMLHEPAVLFLDEPTAGIDPQSRDNFWQLIRGIAAAGGTVLVTTHYMDEAEYCSRLTLMEQGRIIAAGSPSELKRSGLTGRMYEIVAAPFGRVQQVLLQSGARYVEPFGLRFHVLDAGRTDDYAGSIRDLLRREGCECHKVREIQPTLEDLFLALIGTKKHKE
jgi:ABC-2 type transport system ATP-binding protein